MFALHRLYLWDIKLKHVMVWEKIICALNVHYPETQHKHFSMVLVVPALLLMQQPRAAHALHSTKLF